MRAGVGCLCFKRRGGFNRVRTLYRTKCADVRVNAVSPSLLSCLRYISEAIAGATFAVASASPHACLRYTSGAVVGASKRVKMPDEGLNLTGY